MPNVGEWLHQRGDYLLVRGPLVLFSFVIYLLWRTVQLMPRVKPAQIQSNSSSSMRWKDVAGLHEAKNELDE